MDLDAVDLGFTRDEFLVMLEVENGDSFSFDGEPNRINPQWMKLNLTANIEDFAHACRDVTNGEWQRWIQTLVAKINNLSDCELMYLVCSLKRCWERHHEDLDHVLFELFGVSP